MKKFELLAATALMVLAITPATAQTAATTSAQDTAPTNGPGQEAPSAPATTQNGDIIVTAQRVS